jgi:hypothetical protein
MYMSLRIAIAGASNALQLSTLEAWLVLFIMLAATIRVIWAK